MYALFGEDIRLLLMPKRLDDIFFGMHSSTFAIFVIEMFLRGYEDPQAYLRCRNNFPTGSVHYCFFTAIMSTIDHPIILVACLTGSFSGTI